MLSELRQASAKTAGAKQVLRAIAAGQAAKVFVATDADIFVTRRVYDECREKQIALVEVPSMKAVGEACGVAVPAAAAAILRP